MALAPADLEVPDPALELLRRDHHAAFDLIIGPLEEAFAAAIERVLRRAFALAAPGVALTASVDVHALGSIPAGWADEIPELASAVGQVYETGALSAWLTHGDAYNAATVAGLQPFDVVNVEGVEHVRALNNRLVGIGDDAWRRAQASLRQGLADGETVEQIGRRLEADLQVSTSRARTIARTEGAAAMNAGTMTGVRALGPYAPRITVWVAAMDSRTRDSHYLADGQRRIVSKAFDVGGAKLKYPGDPTGPAGEVVNCRCTLTFEESGNEGLPGDDDGDRPEPAPPPVPDPEDLTPPPPPEPAPPALTPEAEFAADVTRLRADLRRLEESAGPQAGDTDIIQVYEEEAGRQLSDLDGYPDDWPSDLDGANAARRALGQRFMTERLTNEDLRRFPSAKNPPPSLERLRMRHREASAEASGGIDVKDLYADRRHFETSRGRPTEWLADYEQAVNQLGARVDAEIQRRLKLGGLEEMDQAELDRIVDALRARRLAERAKMDGRYDWWAEKLKTEGLTREVPAANLQPGDRWRGRTIAFVERKGRNVEVTFEDLTEDVLSPAARVILDGDPITDPVDLHEAVERALRKDAAYAGAKARDADLLTQITDAQAGRTAFRVRTIHTAELRPGDVLADGRRVVGSGRDTDGLFVSFDDGSRVHRLDDDPMGDPIDVLTEGRASARDEYARVAREVLGEVEPMGGKLVEVGKGSRMNPKVREAVDLTGDVFPSSWVEASNTSYNLKVTPSRGRAHYSYARRDPKTGAPFPELLVPDPRYAQWGDVVETAVHEFGHRMEHSRPALRRLEFAFYWRRVGEDPLRHLGPGYGANERAREDKFANAYSGKDYGARSDSYFELFSMGVQSYLSPVADPRTARWVNGMMEDEDYRAFILGSLLAA